MSKAMYTGCFADSWEALYGVSERITKPYRLNTDRNDNVRAITLSGDDFETIYGVFVAHNILQHCWSVFLNPWTTIRAYNVS
jgi:hypothetical protein